MEICQITGIDHKSELPCNNAEEVNAANAHLIAASPMMLEALELALQHLIYDGKHPAVIAAKAAISKARGATV